LGAVSKLLNSCKNCDTSSALFESTLFHLEDTRESISSKNNIIGHFSLAAFAHAKKSLIFLLVA
jgi:hypothetical protein